MPATWWKKLRSDLGSIGSADGRTAERRRTVVSGAHAVNGARIVNGAEKKNHLIEAANDRLTGALPPQPKFGGSGGQRPPAKTENFSKKCQNICLRIYMLM